MKIDLQNVDLKKLGFFRFRPINDKVVLTNDAGNFVILKQPQFERFLSGTLSPEDPFYEDLSRQGFIRETMHLSQLATKFRSKNNMLFTKTGLHIMVLTLRCNLRCTYCQVSAESMKHEEHDMTKETAAKIIDFIFTSPSPSLTIEFQGGEPFVNWEVMKFAIDYALDKHKRRGGDLFLTAVSNGSFIDEKKLEFLIDRKVSLCFSLDGPEDLHNGHRGKNYAQVKKALAGAISAYRKRYPDAMPAALPTITRYSLPFWKELIDEYIEMGLESIHLRPLTPLGYAQKSFKELSYSVEEYLEFYAKALDYIIELNRKGTFFMERYAWIFLSKILTDGDPGYVDICSPCGSGLGVLAYNYNGDIYTCDEGRMFSAMGDESFRCGNVFEHTYAEILQSKPVRTLCVASCLDALPECSHCAYKPYCGACPVLNYAATGNIYAQNPNDFRCQQHKGILDLLFECMQDGEVREIFERWVKNEPLASAGG